MEFENGQESLPVREPCQFCGRKFVPGSLAKHMNVCEKMSNKKRKTFDSAKQRIQGTELAEFAPTDHPKRYNPVLNTPVKEKNIPATKPNHTVHHVPSLKGSNSNSSSKTTSPMNKSSNYERCPYCDRSFGPKAFDRHLEWCKEQSIRINLKSTATQEAKERLEARIKYRAPSFKSKRSITKEKYSPKLKTQDSQLGSSFKNEERREKPIKIIKTYESEGKMKTPTPPEKQKSKENKEVNFIRQNVLRCSYKMKMPKKSESKIEKDKINNHFQNNQKSDISTNIKDWITANGTKIEPLPPPSKISPTNSQLSNSIYDGYDPFLLAEHQMKELFGEDSSINLHLNKTFSLGKRPQKENRLLKQQNKENILYDQCGPVKSKSCQTNDNQAEKHFKTSPTSAFNEYTPSTNVDRHLIRAPTPVPTSELEKDNGNFLPPIINAGFRSDAYNQEVNINRYPLISLSNLSLCSSVSVDMPEENHKLNANGKSVDFSDGAHIPSMVRSASTHNEKSCKNQKQNLRMEHLLYGNEDQNGTIAPVTPEIFNQKLENLNNFLDDENFDLLNSFAEFENALQDSCCDRDKFQLDANSPIDKLGMKLERGDSIASKMSVDSAYNSLNRKSPIRYELSPFMDKTSTPEHELQKSSALSPTSDFLDTQLEPKLSKFCHECGAKFPLAIAKFCCECGVRRLAI